MNILDPTKVIPGMDVFSYNSDTEPEGIVKKIVPIKDWRKVKDLSASGWLNKQSIREYLGPGNEKNNWHLIAVDGPKLGYDGDRGTEVWVYGYDGAYVKEPTIGKYPVQTLEEINDMEHCTLALLEAEKLPKNHTTVIRRYKPGSPYISFKLPSGNYGVAYYKDEFDSLEQAPRYLASIVNKQLDIASQFPLQIIMQTINPK